MASNISVVIPVHNHFDLLNDLLSNIVWGSSNIGEIVIVDDMSTEKETIDGIEWWISNFEFIKRVKPEKNLGFLISSNLGVESASGDIVCLISTDVIIETDLGVEVSRIIREDPNVLIGGIVYNGSTGWNQFGQKVFPYAEGWLLAFTKENWRKWGGFDIRFAPNDFEDVDLSTTVLKMGSKLVPLNNSGIRHIGAQSIGYSEQREELTRKNRLKFEEKWITKN